jgi:hypothetical protein
MIDVQTLIRTVVKCREESCIRGVPGRLTEVFERGDLTITHDRCQSRNAIYDQKVVRQGDQVVWGIYGYSARVVSESEEALLSQEMREAIDTFIEKVNDIWFGVGFEPFSIRQGSIYFWSENKNGDYNPLSFSGEQRAGIGNIVLQTAHFRGIGRPEFFRVG